MQASSTDTELRSPDLSILNDEVTIDSSLTFTYFLDFLRSMGEQNKLYKPFFAQVVRRFEAVPELQGIIKDPTVLQQHPQILTLLEATLFPPADQEGTPLFAFSTPWHFRPFHASPKFNDLLYHNIILSNREALLRFRHEKAERLFAQILRRHYGLQLDLNEQHIYPAVDHETGLTRYYQVHFDTRFCDAIAKGPLPPIDRDYIEKNFSTLCDGMKLASLLPPEGFALEGFSVIRVTEVTETAAVTELKNLLLRMVDEEPSNYFNEAEKVIQSLLGAPGASVSLLPFPRINDHLCWWGETQRANLLGALLQQHEAHNLFQEMEAYFTAHPYPLLLSSFAEAEAPSFLQELKTSGVKSYLIMPLFRGRALIGVLEVAVTEPDVLQKQHVFKLRSAQVLLIQMVANYLQRLSENVEQLIKTQFTSLQSSVEWKFKEVAYHYLKERHANPGAEIGKLAFEQVYPAYGAVDIRNSSVKRGEAIQKDLVEHLELIGLLVGQLRQQQDLPILQEMEFKAGQFLELVKGGLTVENEAYVSSFIDTEVTSGLRFLSGSFPTLQAPIRDHLARVDKERGTSCQNRRQYEQSVETINRTLAAYLQKEEEKLQTFYPHLYEIYKTDGVEYNIYIGQSIQPHRFFHPLHRRNIYLWQLNTMIDMARLTHALEPTLAVPLQTTQLILLYGSRINISFRRDERKFDVDDAYNIRYELLKKRIDKVCIKDTQERLTQPGTIAVIYSRAKDVEVFEKYIDFLVSAGRLLPGVEQLELEDTQGVTGLRALRMQVRFEPEG